MQDLFYEPARGRRDRNIEVRLPALRPAPKKPTVRRSFPGFRVTGLGAPQTTYSYADLSGEIHYVIGRYLDKKGEKSFRQFTPDPKKAGHWFRQGPTDDEKLLYRLQDVADACAKGGTVCIVEGEKDADVGAGLEGCDWAFTSAAGGAKAPWLAQYTEALTGAGDVVVIADRDEPGYRRAAEVAHLLAGAGLPVRVLEAREGKDLADHIAAGWQIGDLDPVVADPEEEPEPQMAAAPPSIPPKAPVRADDDDSKLPRRYASGPRYAVARGQLWRVTIERRPTDDSPRELYSRVLGADARLSRMFVAVTGDEALDQEAASAPSRVELAVVYPDDEEAGPEVHTFDLKRWRSGDWLDVLRPTAYFDPSRQGRNAAIAAVRAVSESAERVTQHVATGWRIVNGNRCYVHAGGAIGADGAMALNVELPPQLARYRLPDPPEGVEAIAAAARLSTGMVGLDWLPDRLGFALLGIVYRAILPGSNVVGLLTEIAGAGKSSLMIPAVQHFAPSITYRAKATTSMAELGASPKAVQRLTHAAADTVLVVDDFPPQTRGATASTATQAAFIRAVYDRSARDTLTMDRRMVPGPAARGAVLTAAEYAPVDTGARDRALLMPMPGWGTAPPVKQLRWLERPEAARGRSKFMAALIRHVAAISLDELSDWTVGRDDENARAVAAAGFPTRLAEHIGKALTGWDLVLGFLTKTSAWPSTEVDGLRHRVWAAAVDAAEAATDRDADQSAAHRFVRLLREAIGSSAHIADRANPETWPMGLDPIAAGWVPLPGGSSEGERQYMPRGDRIGWVVDDRVWIHPGRALRVAIAAAESEGVHLQALTDRAAGDLLATAGWIQADKGRNTIQRRISGKPERVWSLPASLFWSTEEEQDVDAGAVPPMPRSDDDHPESNPAVCLGCGESMVPIDGASVHPNCTTGASLSPAQGDRGAHAPTEAAKPAEGGYRAAEVVLSCEGVHWPDGTVSELPCSIDDMTAAKLAIWAVKAKVGRGGGKTIPEPGHLYLARDLVQALGLPTGDSNPRKRDSQLRAARRKPFWSTAEAEGFTFSANDRLDGGWIRLWRKAGDGLAAGSAVITSPVWVHTFHLLQDVDMPAEVAARLRRFHDTLGVPLKINEGVTALGLMNLPGIDLPSLPWPQMAADFSWRRPLTSTEQSMRWVHAYDRRASYLPGIGAVEAGGELVREVSPSLDPKRAGFWRISSLDGWDSSAIPLPDPLAVDGAESRTFWVTSSMLSLLAEYGPVDVHEGWFYTAPERLLDKPYRQLMTALKLAKSAGDLVTEKALKAAYTTGIGMLDQMKHRETSGEYGHRPDLRAQIISTHRANSLRAMLAAAAAGFPPVAMAKRDAVLFISDEADPIAAWPGDRSNFEPHASGRNGKYKPAGSMPLEEWLARESDASPAALITAVTDHEEVK